MRLSKFETLEDRQAHEARLHDEAVRAARVKAARACKAWEEIIPAQRLCSRGPARLGWAVDSETDVLSLYPGVVFQSGSASIVADRNPLCFTVVDDNLAVYERVTTSGLSTWSDVVRRRPELVGAATT